MDRKVNIGDRVILKSNCGFTLGRGNPEQKSKYACEGTVEELPNPKQTLSIRVLWDNGHPNGYRPRDLIVIGKCKDNPNMSFRLKKEKGE